MSYEVRVSQAIRRVKCARTVEVTEMKQKLKDDVDKFEPKRILKTRRARGRGFHRRKRVGPAGSNAEITGRLV